MSPSIHLPTTKKKNKQKSANYTQEKTKKKKKKKICQKKIGVCLLLPPHMSVPATTKNFFHLFHPCFSYVYLDPSSVTLPSRPVCASCISLWSSGPKCFPPAQICKVFQLCFHRDRCAPVVSVCGHPDQNVFYLLRYAKYFSYASIETGVCVFLQIVFFLQIQEIIPRKNILLF